MKNITIYLLACVIFSSYSHAGPGNRGLQRLQINDQSGQKIGTYSGSYALVIGVSDYNNGWPKLPGVQADVDIVVNALRSNGFTVETALNPDAVELPKVFERFINKYGNDSDNRLLFYYAGHGHTLSPSWGGQPIGYIVPKDAPNPNMQEIEFKKAALPMQRIEEYALNINSKHAMFLFDSCFSGSLFSITRAIPEHISYKTLNPVRQFITAGSADETVPDVSIFRQQFISALKGEGDINKDGFLTGTELGQFLQNKVINYSKGSQHPQYGKIRNPYLDKGDFVFSIIAKDNAKLNVLVRGHGVFEWYATTSGSVSMDGSGDNSPTAKALAKVITDPSMRLNKLARSVRNMVAKETNGNQVTAWEDIIIGDDISLAEDNGRIKISLVIANANYTQVFPLKNPINDAKLIGEKLEDIGFEVTYLIDGGIRETEKEFSKIRKRLSKLKSEYVFVLYYVGHGIEVSGDHYLIPIDAKIDNVHDVKYEAISFSRIKQSLGSFSKNGYQVYFFDTDRNNPFSTNNR